MRSENKKRLQIYPFGVQFATGLTFLKKFLGFASPPHDGFADIRFTSILLAVYTIILFPFILFVKHFL